MTTSPTIAALLALLLGGCGLHTAPDSASDDTDADADTDADSDTDSDTDVDTDADTDGACPLNSGWPCTCDFPGGAGACGDGSDCILIRGIGDKSLGYCAASCMGKGASCPDTDFAGSGECLVSDGKGDYWCVLNCTRPQDCPEDQDCDTSLGTGLCYPT